MADKQAHLDKNVREDIDRAMECKDGLVVWRSKKLTLERVKSEEFGTFYNGDCYLVLDRKSSSIHFWLGANSSQDEQGFMAIMSVEVDDYLGVRWKCAAVQYREVQDHESDAFKKHFKNQLVIKKGGYESGFNKVTQRFEPHLYEVKGKVNPIVKEVTCKTSSLRSDDCYILDGEKTYGLYILHGKKSNKRELSKAIQMATSKIRPGKPPVICGEQDLNADAQTKKVLQKLLGVSATREVKFDCVDNISDEEHETDQQRQLKLYRARDDTFEEVTPILQSNLDKGDCFVLNTGSKVFVWKGSFASHDERKSAQEKAYEFIKLTGMPKYSQVVIVPQNAEPADFTACFKDWKSVDETEYANVDYSKPVRKTSNVAKSVHTMIDFRTLYEKNLPDPEDDPYRDDDGSGKVVIYLVQPGSDNEQFAELVKQEKEAFVFNSGDSYLIPYTCARTPTRNREEVIIYYWIGNESDKMEVGTAGILASKYDERNFQDRAIQERVLEGRESPHFMKIFGGHIMIKQDRFNRNKKHLFHVKGKQGNIKVVEVAVDAENLNSNDCFILQASRKVYVWLGKGSLGDEQLCAKEAANDMYPTYESKHVQEMYTPEEFWEAIGGKKPYHTTPTGNQGKEEVLKEREPRLFHMYNLGRGLEAEEIYDFFQDDLIENDTDVFVLDTFKRLYVWIGRGCRRDEKQDTIKYLPNFIQNDPTARKAEDVQISFVCQGHESRAFKAYFGQWEDGRVNEMSLEEMKRLHVTANSVTDGADLDQMINPTNFYSYDILKIESSEELPWDVLPDQREMFLSDGDFLQIFGMAKVQFSREKPWKRNDLKKRLNLF